MYDNLFIYLLKGILVNILAIKNQMKKFWHLGAGFYMDIRFLHTWAHKKRVKLPDHKLKVYFIL
jgi:hypothetical protein